MSTIEPAKPHEDGAVVPVNEGLSSILTSCALICKLSWDLTWSWLGQVLSAAPPIQQHYQPDIIPGMGSVTAALVDVVQGVAGMST